MEAKKRRGRERVPPDSGAIWQAIDRATAFLRPTRRADLSGHCGALNRSTGGTPPFFTILLPQYLGQVCLDPRHGRVLTLHVPFRHNAPRQESASRVRLFGSSCRIHEGNGELERILRKGSAAGYAIPSCISTGRRVRAAMRQPATISPAPARVERLSRSPKASQPIIAAQMKAVYSIGIRCCASACA
jgi:hypothetical protein